VVKAELSRKQLEGVRGFIGELYGHELHAKRVDALAGATLGMMAGATLGVMAGASLAVAMIGQALAQARGLVTKHAVKQVDRLMSNQGIDVWDSFAHWVPQQVGAQQDILGLPGRTGLRLCHPEWVGKGGRARKLRDARVTAPGRQVGAVVCVRAKGMKEPWCLATSGPEATAAVLVNHYARRWTIEPAFRDTTSTVSPGRAAAAASSRSFTARIRISITSPSPTHFGPATVFQCSCCATLAIASDIRRG